MMVIFDYSTKRELKASIGKPLKVIGKFNIENTCNVYGHNNPTLNGFNREFWANVELVNGLIRRVK